MRVAEHGSQVWRAVATTNRIRHPVRPCQLAILTFQLCQPPSMSDRRSGVYAGIDLLLSHPVPKHPGWIPNCSRTRADVSPRIAGSRRRWTVIRTACPRWSSKSLLGAAMSLIPRWTEWLDQSRHETLSPSTRPSHLLGLRTGSVQPFH